MGQIDAFESDPADSLQQRTATRGDIAAREFDLDLATFQGWKSKFSLGMVCGRQNSVRTWYNQLNYIE